MCWLQDQYYFIKPSLNARCSGCKYKLDYRIWNVNLPNFQFPSSEWGHWSCLPQSTTMCGNQGNRQSLLGLLLLSLKVQLPPSSWPRGRCVYRGCCSGNSSWNARGGVGVSEIAGFPAFRFEWLRSSLRLLLQKGLGITRQDRTFINTCLWVTSFAWIRLSRSDTILTHTVRAVSQA